MNILIIAHRVPFPPNKGEKIRTYYQIRHLARQGHSVSLACLTETEQDIANLEQLGAKHCDAAFHAPLPGKLAWPKALLGGAPISVANFYSSRLQQQIDEALNQQQVDVILCTSSSLAPYVQRSRVLAMLRPKPALLMDFMDLDSDKWQQYASQSSFPKSWIYRRESVLLAQLEQAISRDFDAAFFISQNEVELMGAGASGPLDNVSVIANGIDAAEFAPDASLRSLQERTDAPVFIFTGVMDYLPNEDAVCWFADEVWPSIIASNPKAEFQIVGMSPSDRVKALAEREGIVVTGMVDDVVIYYQRADVFVAPFRLARGVQNKVLQAFACALPVVATPMACEGIAVHSGHDVLIAGDASEFLAHSQALISDAASRRTLGDSARKLVLDNYAWESCLRPLDDLLQRCAPVAVAGGGDHAV